MTADGDKIIFRDIIKRFLLIQIPLACLIALMSIYAYTLESNNDRSVFEVNEFQLLKHQGEMMSSAFKMIVSDLMLLTDYHGLREYLKYGKAEDKMHIAMDFLSLSGRKGTYVQIRYIDNTGMEIVRVNYNNGAPSVVPDDSLQDKGDRYYFTDTIKLDYGEIFVSPFDLNIELGEIETPYKPVIRFGTPVFDDKSINRGIVVLNYLGEGLIKRFRKKFTESQGEPMLLNSEGYWLLGPEAEKEWGFMFNNDITFEKDFPDIWEHISEHESGQFTNGKGLFSFITVYPLIEGWKSSTGSPEAFMPSEKHLDAKSYYWKAVSHVPAESLDAAAMPLFRNTVIIYLVLFSLLGVLSWFLALLSLKRKLAVETLRRYSMQDALTGLANRRHFNNVFEHEWRRALREKNVLSIIMVDIDFFKSYNDIYGHQAGDECLSRLGKCLMTIVHRPGDLMARYGGEEFVAVLPNTEFEGALKIAESMREDVQALNMPHKGSATYRHVTISAGVASIVPDSQLRSFELLEKADKALYQAKDDGRNRVKGTPTHFKTSPA